MTIPSTSSSQFNPLAAVLINRNAKQVTKKITADFQEFARKQKRVEFRVFESGSLEELEEIIQKEIVQQHAALVGAVGGDGSLYQIWNRTYNTASGAGQRMPAFALFGCGTGNALAGLVGSQKYRVVLERLGEQLKKKKDFSHLPLEEYPLIRMEGETSAGECKGPFYFTFAGSGLDAEVLNMYNNFKEKQGKHWWSEGLLGYAVAGFRTMYWQAKKEDFHLAIKVHADHYDRIHPHEPKRVEIPITSEEDILKDEKEVHAVIVGTSPQYGFGFKAFPFAPWAGDCNGGKFHVRVVAGPRGEVIDNILSHLLDWHRLVTPWRKGTSLWKGNYLSPYIQEYFLDDFTLEYQGAGSGISTQIAGEYLGEFRKIHYQKASEKLRLYNAKPQPWRMWKRKKE